MESSDSWVFLDGQYKQQALAVLPVADRGFQFGDGVFTTVRVSHGQPELLSSHLERLYRHAEIVGFTIPAINVSAIEMLIALNDAKQGIWRLKIIATASEEGSRRCLGHVLMTLAPYKWQPFRPVRLALFPHPMERPLAEVKSLSYLDYLYAERCALQQGADEALLCGRDGVILETNRSNVFWIHESTCFIPDERLPYLKGVFLQYLKTLIPFPIQSIQATLDAVPRTANLFICNAMTHLRPVLSIGELIFKQNVEIEGMLKRCLESEF
jgi:branched-subunit amino acid aminotransferase/4-amino-4-deoxychorismate lyase